MIISLSFLLSITTNAQYKIKLDSLKKELETAKKNKLSKQIATCLEKIGELYENNNDYNMALSYYNQTLNISKHEKNKKETAYNLSKIGNIYFYQSNYDKALEYYQEALLINEKNNNKIGVANNLGNIGNIFYYQNDFDKALDNYKKTINIQKEIKDTFGITRSYINIANIYSYQENYKKALIYYEKAINIQKKVDDKSGLALSYTNIGVIYENKNILNKAADFYQKALCINKEINNNLDIAYNFIKISGVNYKLKDYEKCIFFAQKSIAFAKQQGNLNIQKDACNYLSEAYIKLKQYKKAIKYKDSAIIFKDSIFSINKSKAIAEIQIKYETEKKEKQILKQLADLKNNQLQLLKEKAESEKKEIQRNLSVIGLIISIVFMIIIFNSKKQKQKINNLLKKEKRKLESINTELTQINEELKVSLDLVKEQHQVIEENEEKFRITINSANDAIILINNNEEITYWNKSAEKIFGYTQQKVINKNIHNLITPEKYREAAHKAFAVFKQTGKGNALSKTIELEGVKKNGEIFPIELSLSAIKIKNKQNAIGIVRDISKRKNNELRLKEINKQKEILINNIPAAVFYKDLNLRYIEVNKKYAEILQKQPEEIIGKTDKEIIFDKEIIKEYEELDKKVIKSKKAVLDYVKSHKENNKIYWISTSKIPYFDANNKIAGVISVVRDITKQIENEKAIEESKNKIEEIYNNITDNITYAKVIQQSLLPDKNTLDKYLSDYFLFFKPKGIIGGDFYYVNKIKNNLIIAVADCTGHGVSGALLSILGITFLHDIINETTKPKEILNLLRTKIKNIFKAFGSNDKDGMDIAICVINTETKILKYSGAFNPLWLIRNNQLYEYNATRNPIGFYYYEKEFEETKVKLQKKDTIYMFSDGFADQFNGENGEKLKNKNFKKILLDNADKPMQEQKQYLVNSFEKWKGKSEQIDDIVVLGVKF
jgi:PAS domain S-box-containing protein